MRQAMMCFRISRSSTGTGNSTDDTYHVSVSVLHVKTTEHKKDLIKNLIFSLFYLLLLMKTFPLSNIQKAEL